MKILYLVLIIAVFTIATDMKKEFKVTSESFADGGTIPVKFTCDGKNISPEISWEGIPEETVSIALICDDPDAPMGTWVHWLVYNIPPDMNTLNEEFTREAILPNGIKQGTTDFKSIGYGGPCPPSGTHRYFFKIYALNKIIEKGPGMTKIELLKEMEGHILAHGELIGKYKRNK